ncbi:hypothetical protein FQR65_LT04273 [Abscondita terminalis]|nr:hypothetical protein FQR65_LT04273 [Abscondita terminalis]
MGVILYMNIYDEIDLNLFNFFRSKLHNANGNGSVKWLVITHKNYIEDFFLLFWRYEMLNVVVLSDFSKDRDNSYFELITSNPQSITNSCGQYVNSIHRQSCNSEIAVVFPKLRRNYTNCNITLCSAYRIAAKPQNEMLVSVFLMNIITTRLHANLFIDHGRCEIGLKIINTFLRRKLYTQNSIIFYTSTPLWAVPKPKIISPMESITRFFKISVWILILLSILITTTVWWLMVKHQDNDFFLILLEVWRVSLFGSINKVPIRWELRFVLIGYIIYCIHIQAVFTSKVVEILTVPQYERGIQNLKELSESNFTIFVDENHKGILFDYDNESQDSFYKKLHPKLQSIRSVELIRKFLKCVVKDAGCAAFFLGDEEYLNDTILDMSRVIRDNSVIGNLNYVFMTTKHSYLSLTLNDIMFTIVESGISDYYADHVLSQWYREPLNLLILKLAINSQ